MSPSLWTPRAQRGAPLLPMDSRSASSFRNLTRWRYLISALANPFIDTGQVIGRANRDIAQGAWVREEMLDLPCAPALDDLGLATAVPDPLPPLQGVTFEGFRNTDGSVGTKNILGITTTVQCVAPTVDYAVRRIKAELLNRFPNVDDVVAITHGYGCGIAIDAPGATVPIQSCATSASTRTSAVGRYRQFGVQTTTRPAVSKRTSDSRSAKSDPASGPARLFCNRRRHHGSG